MLHYFKLWLSVGWIMVAALSYFSLISNPPELDIDFESFDKVRHFVAYFILMFWFSQLYKKRQSRISYALFFIILGIILEILQGLGGVRYFEYYDMLANTVGVAIAWLITKKRWNNIFFLFEKMIVK